MKLKLFLLIASLVGGASIPTRSTANDQVPGTPQTQPILIRGATLHTVDNGIIDAGDLLFVDGKIEALGKTLAVPQDARVIEAGGKHVYPGLIDSMTDLGLREISAVPVSIDRSERGTLNPNVRSWVAVNPDSELIPVARAGGILVAHVAPTGSYLRGQSAVLRLDGWTAKEMTVTAPAGLCVSWNSLNPNDNDAGKEAKKRNDKLRELDELIEQARRYGDAKAQSKSEGDAFTVDLRLEALLPVIERRMPIYVEVNEQSAIESAVAYCVERDLDLVIYGGYDAEGCADLLKRYDVPVIITRVYRLPRRRDDAYDAAYTLPARLQQAGVRFVICGEGAGYPGGASNARNLPYHAACAVAYGLSREHAVRSITLSAAETLGVDHLMGSLTVGKEATLIIANGDILETETNVLDAYVQGRQVDLSSKHTMLFEKYQQKYQQP